MDDRALALLTRLTEALERLAPPPPPPVDLYAAEAFVWHPVAAASGAGASGRRGSTSGC